MRSFAPLVAAAGFVAVPAAALAQSPPLLRELRRSVPADVIGPESLAGAAHRSFADVDGDGDLDTAQAGHLLLNDGGGVFTAVAELTLPANAWEIQTKFGELDGDGDFDAAHTIGKSPSEELWIELNDGQGHFTPAGPPFVFGGYANVGLFDLGDLDGDLDLDLLVPRYDDLKFDPAVLLLNDGTAHFSDASAQIAQLDFTDHLEVVLVDLDGDGDLDAFADGDPSYNESDGLGVPDALAINTGGGNLSLVTGSPPYAISSSMPALADADGDRDVDLWRDGPQLLLNDGSNHFVDGSSGLPSLAGYARWATVGDLDGDGDVDGVLANDAAGASVTVLNDGHARFTALAGRWPGWLAKGPCVDVDADGDRDWFHGSGVLFNRGDGELTSPLATLLGHGYGVFELLTVDVDADGAPDVFAREWRGPLLYRNRGNGTFVGDAASGLSDEEVHLATFADLDGDGDADFAAWSPASALHLALNDGAGSFAPGPAIVAPPPSPLSVLAHGDLDSDGDQDLLGATYPARVWLNDGAANLVELSNAWPASSSIGPQIALGDLDGDGDLDALTAGAAGGARVVLNDGAARFALDASVFASAGQVRDPLLGDVDGDGDLDLAATPVFVAATLLALNDGHGVFTDATATLPPLASAAASIAMLDFDGDGDRDLVLWTVDALALLANDGHGAFADAGTLTSTSYDAWRGSFADLDFDRDVDAVVAGWEGVTLLTNVTRQVAWRAPPRVHRALELELHGPPHAHFQLYASLGATHLPFGPAGTLLIDRSRIVATAGGVFDAMGSALARRAVPDDPAFLGLTHYWQALVAHSRRLTNVEIAVIEGY